LGWKTEVITSSHHLCIITFLEVARRSWEDMEMISAVFSGPMISEEFGKLSANLGVLLSKVDSRDLQVMKGLGLRVPAPLLR
jgi:hypothetical protein